MTILRDSILSLDPGCLYSTVLVCISHDPDRKQAVVSKGQPRKPFPEVCRKLRDPVRMGWGQVIAHQVIMYPGLSESDQSVPWRDS